MNNVVEKKKKKSQKISSIFSVVIDHVTPSERPEEWVDTLIISEK